MRKRCERLEFSRQGQDQGSLGNGQNGWRRLVVLLLGTCFLEFLSSCITKSDPLGRCLHAYTPFTTVVSQSTLAPFAEKKSTMDQNNYRPLLPASGLARQASHEADKTKLKRKRGQVANVACNTCRAKKLAVRACA